MSRRILTLFGTLGLVAMMVAPAWATVGPPVSVRLLGEPKAAVPGEAYEGTLEIRFSGHAHLDDVVMTGEGWSLRSIEPIEAVAAKDGDLVRLPFVVVPSDADQPLVASLSLGGQIHETHFYLSEREILRAKQPFGVRVIADDGHLPGIAAQELVKPGTPRSEDEPAVQPNNVDWDDSDDMQVEVDKKARNIRVHGRFGYNRTDGPFIGGDGIWVRIYDEDGLGDEELASVVTDAYGYYDVTFYWDPCAVFCDGQPDIYVRFDCNNSKVDVTNTGGSVYAWQTGTTNDYAGTNLNMGTLAPGAESDDPAVHILTNGVRTWRWMQNRGYDNGECPFRWPDGTGGAWWSPGSQDVHIGTGSQWGEDVHSHEYGHDWHNTFAVNQNPDYCNGICDTPTCGHCLWCQETNHDAWNEGFPDWMGDTIPGSWGSTYGLAPWSKYNFEGLSTCGGSVDNSELTEGILAALLLDIQDSNQDNHGAFPGVQDALSLGEDEILKVTADDHPLNPTSFLTKFKARYPQHCENLWETAANCGYQIDLSNPGVVSGLNSPSHSTSGDSPDNTIQFNWGVATDDCSGIAGYSIVVGTGVSLPNATQDIGDVTTYTTSSLAPGTYYFSIRAVDRAGRWSSTYTWTGPYTIRAPEPANLTHFVKTGWTYPVIPRQTTDATFSSAPVPTSLIGNTTSTYWNTLGINDGESSTGGGFQGRLYVDNVYRVGASWGAVNAGTQPYAVNWVAHTVIGGRHVYETRWDALEQVAETNEGDNVWGRSWNWTPLELAVNTSATRSAPPDSDGGWSSVVGQTLWYNCDGLRFPNTHFWEALTIRATNNAENYDIRMHLGTTSPTTGFDSNVGWSARAPGCLDAILVNRNQTGFGQEYDGGVLNHNGGTGSYVAAARGQTFHVFGDSINVSFAAGEMLKLREFYTGTEELGPVSITVDIDPAAGPIYALWLDPSFTTGDLLDYDAMATSDASGRARLDFTASVAGYNCLVIYRDPKDGTAALTATVEIDVTPPDFQPYQSAGWYSPLVPRPAADGTSGSVPIPTVLHGNQASTYYNLAAINSSPSGAASLPLRIFIDGEYQAWVVWGAHGGGFIGRFNWGQVFTIRGGRHQLSDRMDALSEYEEIYESNNVFGESWVWTGLDLALATPVSRSAPSDRTGGWADNTVGEGLWYNCDGFQSTAQGGSGYWSAYALLPNSTGTDVDMRLHPHSTGPKNGFAGTVTGSFFGPGQSDIVFINNNLAGFADVDAGVLSSNNNGSFTIETVDAPYMAASPSGVYGPFTVGASRVVNLHEVWLTPDVYIIHLVPQGTPVDWGLSVLPHNQAYMNKLSRHPNGLAYLAPEGQEEVVTIQITEEAYYCIAAWKASSADRLDAGGYTLEIFNGITSVDDEVTPVATRLAGVHPNPFNPRTTVHFDLAREGQVQVDIFDARGQLVRTLLEGMMPAGSHELVWDGIDDRGASVASGVYHFRLTAPGVVDRAKAVLVK